MELDGKAAEFSFDVMGQLKPRSAKRSRAAEVEMDVVVSGHVSPSLAAIALEIAGATATKTNETTEAGPQFVFSAPVFLHDNKGNGRCFV